MNHAENLQGIFNQLMAHDSRPPEKKGVGSKPGQPSRLQIKKVVVEGSAASVIDVVQTNPTDGGVLINEGFPIWETGGPIITDINQNQLSDCYFLATLASLANCSNGKAYLQTILIPDPATQNGVITYYTRDGITTRIHSDILVATFANNSPGDLWPEIFEKTYALFREGADTYNSLNFGSSASVASDLGCVPIAINSIGTNLYPIISAGLAAQKILVLDTVPSNPALPNLVADHCYTVVGIDALNNIKLYNPWGVLAPDQNRVVAPADFTMQNFTFMESGTTVLPQVQTPDPTIALNAKIAALQQIIANAKKDLA